MTRAYYSASCKRLPVNPARGLKIPKVSKPKKRYLSHEQVTRLTEAVDGIGKGMYRGAANHFGLLILVLAYCGLRWSEASVLRVMDVDVKRGRLEIQRTGHRGEGRAGRGTAKEL